MRLFLSWVVVAATAVSAAAQPAAPRRLTLTEAVQTALDNNFNVRKAENSLELQDELELNAYGQFLPSVNGNLNTTRRTGRQFVQEQLRYDDFTTTSGGGGLQVNLPLFTGFQNISNLRGTQARKVSTSEGLRRTKENIIFTTASQFLGVLLNEELVVISRQNLESARRQLDQIRAQVEVGMRPIVDQYNQEALVANAEYDLIQRENAVNLSKVQLIRTLNLDPLLDYELVTPGVDESDLVVNTYDLGGLVQQALVNRSDIRSEEAAIKANRFALQAARGSVLPTLSASFSLSSGWSNQFREPAPGGGFQSVSYGDQFFDRNITRSMSISLQVPIFNRFNTRANIARNRVAYENARLDLEDRRLSVLQEVRQAYNDYLAYSKQLQTTQTALLAATKAYETEQERYRVGATTLIELTRANTEFINARSNRVRAMYQFLFQEKLLDYYIGNIDESIGF